MDIMATVDWGVGASEAVITMWTLWEVRHPGVTMWRWVAEGDRYRAAATWRLSPCEATTAPEVLEDE